MGSEGAKKCYEIISPYRCPKCSKEFGLTNLEYSGVRIWVACDCFPIGEIRMVNMSALSDKMGLVHQ